MLGGLHIYLKNWWSELKTRIGMKFMVITCLGNNKSELVFDGNNYIEFYRDYEIMLKCKTCPAYLIRVMKHIFYMEASKLKWVNSNYILYGVNWLRIESFHIESEFYLYYCDNLMLTDSLIFLSINLLIMQ